MNLCIIYELSGLDENLGRLLLAVENFYPDLFRRQEE